MGLEYNSETSQIMRRYRNAKRALRLYQEEAFRQGDEAYCAVQASHYRDEAHTARNELCEIVKASGIHPNAVEASLFLILKALEEA